MKIKLPHKPEYDRYYPKLGLVAASLEYEIGDYSPGIQTIQWEIHLIEIDDRPYLQPIAIKRVDGGIVDDDCFQDLTAVKLKTSVISQAHKLLSELTAMALSAKQYELINKR